jgi:hypothetical protein
MRGDRLQSDYSSRPLPMIIKSKKHYSNVVSEVELISVLCTALPWWSPPTVPSAYHELKLWGKDAVFSSEAIGISRTGSTLVKTLLNDADCRANTVPLGGSYLLDSPFGIRPALIGGEDAIRFRGEAHFGQLLQIMGECGIAANTRVTTSSGRVGTLSDILQDAVSTFSLYETELEFIACGLAYWRGPLWLRRSAS